MKNFAIKSDKTLDFLRSDVKFVKQRKIKSKNEEIKSLELSEVQYNKNGDRILKCSFDDNNNLTFKQETIFKKGVKNGYINYDVNDNIRSSGEFNFDDCGRISSKTHNGFIEEEYRYDTNSRITRVLYPNTGDKDDYKYDINNLVILQINSYGNEIHFKNDKLGNVIEMKTYEISNRNLILTESRNINEYGDEIESVILNEAENIIFKSTYKYEYDAKDNWISQIAKHSSGISFEITREIDYFLEIKDEIPTMHKSNGEKSANTKNNSMSWLKRLWS